MKGERERKIRNESIGARERALSGRREDECGGRGLNEITERAWIMKSANMRTDEEGRRGKMRYYTRVEARQKKANSAEKRRNSTDGSLLASTLKGRRKKERGCRGKRESRRHNGQTKCVGPKHVCVTVYAESGRQKVGL